MIGDVFALPSRHTFSKLLLESVYTDGGANYCFLAWWVGETMELSMLAEKLPAEMHMNGV